MDLNGDFHLKTLKAEFERRQSVNHRYSLRAYARDLGLDPGLLSRLLASKRLMAISTAKRVADRLRLVPEEQERFVRSAALHQALRFLKGHGLEITGLRGLPAGGWSAGERQSSDNLSPEL